MAALSDQETSRLSAIPTAVHRIDPLRDARWCALVARHPRASIFHTRAWLQALQRTYGYTPVAYTTTPPGDDLRDGLVFCRVESWLTGRRLVSLPFSDHCEPLIEDSADLQTLYLALARAFLEENLRYVELRLQDTREAGIAPFRPYSTYCLHRLDLRADVDVLFRSLHKDSVQRKVRRAEREQLTCEVGASNWLLDSFWRLFLMTRRRHQNPPQPKTWFRNLFDCLGPAATLRVAFHGKQPVAAMILLSHKDTVVYKYGCSDARFNNLGGMPFLFWTSIQEAKRDGFCAFDFGRSDSDNTGLITFKDRLGGRRSELTYTRTGVSGASTHHRRNWTETLAKRVIAQVPDTLWAWIGSLLYRHVG